MEPHLVANEEGLVVAAIEKSTPPAGEPIRIDRDGWTCRSNDGTAWECKELEPSEGTVDFADPWLTDSRGEECERYDGTTLVALQGAFGFRRYLEPFAIASRDAGRTWSDPDLIPSNDPIADGTKAIFTGALYAAWRDFGFATGARLSKLGTETDPCKWGQPFPIAADGHDHPRLAEGTEEGRVAYRGSTGATTLDFTEYGAEGAAEEVEEEKTDHQIRPFGPPSQIGTTTPLFVLTQLCDSADGHCFAAYDLGQTLVKGAGDTYFATWIDRPAPDPRDRRFTVVRLARSGDGGRTWSPPEVVAGKDGAAAWMPALDFDETTGVLVLAYVERDNPDDRVATMRVRTLAPGGDWSAPTDAGTTYTWTEAGTERHLGDYFGLQADAGRIDLVFQNVTDETPLAQIDYARLEERP